MFYSKKNIINFCCAFIVILQASNRNCMTQPLARAGMSQEMLKRIGEIGLQALNNEKAKKAALAAAQNGSKLAIAADAFVGFTGCTYSIFMLGKDVKSYISPTEEQKTQAITVEEMREFHKSKKALKHCLITNAHCVRGPSGRPIVCEKEVRRFAVAASDEELDEITTTFNNYYTE